MTTEILIGEQPVNLCGNAATAIRYKQIFRKDLLMSFRGMSEDQFDADVIKELAYVMNMQAQGTDFKQVTFDSFVDWIAQYEENDFLMAAPDVINAWMVNTQTSSKAKKK